MRSSKCKIQSEQFLERRCFKLPERQAYFCCSVLSALRVEVKRLDLDRGFYSVPMMRWLQALRIYFLMLAIIPGSGGGNRALC